MANGVTEYTTARLIVPVHFPKELEGCHACPFKRYRNTGSVTRIICSQTYEALDDLDRLRERGKDCPLIFGERDADHG